MTLGAAVGTGPASRPLRFLFFFNLSAGRHGCASPSAWQKHSVKPPVIQVHDPSGRGVDRSSFLILVLQIAVCSGIAVKMCTHCDASGTVVGGALVGCGGSGLPLIEFSLVSLHPTSSPSWKPLGTSGGQVLGFALLHSDLTLLSLPRE